MQSQKPLIKLRKSGKTLVFQKAKGNFTHKQMDKIESVLAPYIQKTKSKTYFSTFE